MLWGSSLTVHRFRRYRWLLLTLLLIWAGLNPAVWLLLFLLIVLYLYQRQRAAGDVYAIVPVWLRENGSGFNAQEQEIQMLAPVLMFPNLCICKVQCSAQQSNAQDNNSFAPTRWLWRWRDQCDSITWSRYCRILHHCQQQRPSVAAGLFNHISRITLGRENRWR